MRTERDIVFINRKMSGNRGTWGSVPQLWLKMHHCGGGGGEEVKRRVTSFFHLLDLEGEREGWNWWQGKRGEEEGPVCWHTHLEGHPAPHTHLSPQTPLLPSTVAQQQTAQGPASAEQRRAARTQGARGGAKTGPRGRAAADPNPDGREVWRWQQWLRGSCEQK